MSAPHFFQGLVEQALSGGEDPTSPPISVSLNGTLAKWRDKIQVLNIRVNDPGLNNHRRTYEEAVAKALSLNIEVILTLPEFSAAFHPAPPEQPETHSTFGPPQRGKPKFQRKPGPRRPVAVFRPCYLAIPRTVSNQRFFHELTVDECLPILEMANSCNIKKVVIPVSEPGLFIDPQASEEFRTKFKTLNKFASERGIQLNLRNGGVPNDFFQKLVKEFKCFMAFDVGTAHLERLDPNDFYLKNRDRINILFFQQVLPGLDKLKEWNERLEKCLKDYTGRLKDFQATQKHGSAEDKDVSGNLLEESYHAYLDAKHNPYLHLGIFQNGDLNLIPLLKTLKKDFEEEKEKFLIFETVPNLKNADFVSRYLFSDSLQNRL